MLRDEGALSRAELADRLDIPRPRLLGELDRLVTGGQIAEAARPSRAAAAAPPWSS
ncbi:hypothetical protein ACFQY4_06095 [Catellatospora bangladeshensis]|uniref:hypothetical protein n=1 Tax=Catellatospora bangladeshensis TaxID=310355 RepID=UPI00361DA154